MCVSRGRIAETNHQQLKRGDGVDLSFKHLRRLSVQLALINRTLLITYNNKAGKTMYIFYQI